MTKCSRWKIYFIFVLIFASIVCGKHQFNSFKDESKSSQLNKDDSKVIPQGYEDSGDNEVFWFVQVTDTQDLWYDSERIETWNKFLDQSYNIIDPLFIVNTGDLVSSDYEHFLTANERSQRVEEWEEYRKSLDDNDVNASMYMDVVGNHDCYGDPGNTYYLKYSMTGSTFEELQHSFKRSFSFGDYAFIGLHTGEDHGIQYPFAVFGDLKTAELDWYEEKLKSYQDCEKIFIFGHHPPFEIVSSWSSSDKSFLDLNDKNNVFAYFCGHGHQETFQNVNGMFAIEADDFWEEKGTYSIVSVDHNYLATSTERVGKWPQCIITNPPRRDYLSNNLEEEDLKEIRTLVWDPKGVDSVEWSAFASEEKQITDWAPLENVSMSGPLWEADFSELSEEMSKYSDLTSCTVKVRVKGGSGEIIEEIIYSPIKTTYIGLYQLIPLFYIAFFSFIALIVITTYYRRTRVPRFKKKEDQLVDKKLRNMYLLKCLVYLALPITFAGMYVGQITAMFAFFYWNANGIHINALLFVYTGTIFAFSILFQGFHLSPRSRDKIRTDTFLSFGWLLFLVVFFTLHFPTISWLSPGLYLMITLDILMLRRNKEMKSFRTLN